MGYMDHLPPLPSSMFIMQNSKHVTIKLVERCRDHPLTPENWLKHELTPNAADDQAIECLLNFSFWSNTDAQFEVLYKGNVYTGYWALCAAVNRAMDEGIDILNPTVYQNISDEQLKHIFRSCTTESIPLFHERLVALQNAGKTLLENFSGAFKNVLIKCDKSASKLLTLLCDYFPNFRDYTVYKGKNVSFMKRAQILVGDLWLCFEGKGPGYFQDADDITAFADYRVPQVLHYFGVIQYSEDLITKIREEIDNGSEFEVEIRAATILAVHNIVKSLKSKNVDCNSILVDNFLWNYRRSHSDEIEAAIPMHRTRCVFY
ncbi:unnamed protein product [Trichobilharzia regenti]|nr:unnamed protein product [Trichobilharzia regenti]